MVKSRDVAPPHTPDDGFHEIQLNGKQLVFLFMAATVVSVVIFLCGVLVGRGVRAERAADGTDAAALSDPLAADRTVEASGSVITPGQDPTVAPAPPLPTSDELSYPDRLGKSASARESIKDSTKVKEPANESPRHVTPESTAARAGDVSSPASPLPAEPASSTAAGAPGPGFAVQVAALNVRTEADAIARRLSAKGYSAYVQPPASGTPSVYRVRVGTFKTKREADTVAARLKKEEKFSPWVTR
jgi:cell division septation protein DedD